MKFFLKAVFVSKDVHFVEGETSSVEEVHIWSQFHQHLRPTFAPVDLCHFFAYGVEYIAHKFSAEIS